MTTTENRSTPTTSVEAIKLAAETYGEAATEGSDRGAFLLELGDRWRHIATHLRCDEVDARELDQAVIAARPKLPPLPRILTGRAADDIIVPLLVLAAATQPGFEALIVGPSVEHLSAVCDLVEEAVVVDADVYGRSSVRVTHVPFGAFFAKGGRIIGRRTAGNGNDLRGVLADIAWWVGEEPAPAGVAALVKPR